MSDPPKHPDARAQPLEERLRPWIAAVVSALLHLLMLFALLYAAKPVVTTPQGATSSGRTAVEFVGDSAPPDPTTPAPPRPKPAKAPKAKSKAVTRKPVDRRKPVREAKLIELPSEAKGSPRDSQDPPEDSRAQAPASSPPIPAPRRPGTWGRPPGYIPEDTPAQDDGRSRGLASQGGNQRNPAAGGPSMEVGGYQIVYDLLAKEKLRGWIERGMKEVYIPLPGTRYLMVCPAEVALRRGSSKCRLLEPGSPELPAIGDARQIITVMYVYHRGELLWRGPGPYR